VRLLLSIASLVGAIVLPFAVISAVVMNLVFDTTFYHDGQAEYHVQDVTHLSPATMDRVNLAIVRFFASSETLPEALAASGAPTSVFNEREILHMNDVRGLIQGIRVIQFATLAYVLVIGAVAALIWQRGGRAALSRMFLLSTAITIGIGVVAGVVTYLWFDQLFLLFHEISFHNNYWQLDPRTDHLIQMFPFEFWYNAMLTVTLRVVLVTSVLGGCGFALRRVELTARQVTGSSTVVSRR